MGRRMLHAVPQIGREREEGRGRIGGGDMGVGEIRVGERLEWLQELGKMRKRVKSLMRKGVVTEGSGVRRLRKVARTKGL
jgi:hypothetical protein